MMLADKYPSIFSPQMEAIVLIPATDEIHMEDQNHGLA